MSTTINNSVVLDSTKLTYEKKAIYVPSLEELKNVLYEALSKNFAQVSVDIVDLPDLRKSPFNLKAEGICGKTTAAQIGGLDNMFPHPRFDKLYDVKKISKHLGFNDETFVFGASFGPWPFVKTKSKLAYNMILNEKPESSGSTITYLEDAERSDKFLYKNLPANEMRFAFAGNLIYTDGKIGETLRIQVKKRLGPDDFVIVMQQALANRYSDKIVVLGGVFAVTNGKVRIQLPLDYSKKPVNIYVKNSTPWFFNYEASSPLIQVGSLQSIISDFEFNYYFHTFSDHKEGGHYLKDTTPEIVEYLAFFTPVEHLFRIDKPKIIHNPYSQV
ncbi:ester hydrolase C11orf54 homolog [Leptopilina heterotoma]|uniref:ester hydrolase C11orf54 homolog n=1 Tax=Leptopilina heterotoma TaxID=63436 RepID=UPI001CA8B0B8|nr:ester hydrolase C11orf54 homolog [Leptopilina heterotoma]